MAKHEIEHQEDEQMFFVDIEEQRAYMRYRFNEEPSATAEEEPSADSSVDFYTTFVPDSLRGQGIAAQLVASGFEWADEQGLQIKASCWYAAKKLERKKLGRDTKRA